MDPADEERAVTGSVKRTGAAVLSLIFLLLAAAPARGLPGLQNTAPAAPSETARPPSTAALTLDGVPLEVTTSFLTSPEFFVSDPTSAIQTATAVEREPVFRELSITVAPFGTSPPTESVPAAGPGREEAYRAALRAYRQEQGGEPRDGPVMRLFGEDIVGSASVVDLRIRPGAPVPVAITEWVVEAGPRIWLVRASWELNPSEARGSAVGEPHYSPSSSILSSSELTAPSSSLGSLWRERLSGQAAATASDQVSDLPFPTWWDGECDTINFHYWTGVPAYPLGAEYRGLKACGPRPWADGGPERWVDFGAGSSQIEWQCPEISKRFLYLAYGIPPYLGNGNDMVANYDGDLLEKVWNDTLGRAPQPGDVLSYGASTTYGHTSVVVSSDVDASGNGTIEVIEQNSSPSGSSTLYVHNWEVTAYTDVIGWLHYPDWTVDYYDDGSLTNPCGSGERGGVYLFESWGDGAPADGCPPDRFGARFSRSIHLAGGDYTFALGYDERARLTIDGETVVNGWDANEHYQTLHLEPGEHQVTVEYHDSGADAALTAFWWGPGFELTRDVQDSSRWYGEHWGNPDLWWDPIVMVQGGDGPLDHSWSSNAPAAHLPVDYFSSRYRRTISLDPGRWHFDLFADDGVRFLIDDVLIVDEWQPQRDRFTPTVTLGGGDHQLLVEHYENQEAADISLDWERVSEAVTPTVQVTSPLTGTLVETCPVTVEAQIGDDVGAVDHVEFHAYYDGRWHHLGDDESSPYTYVWECVSVRNQTARLTAHVWNEAGSEFVDLDTPVSVALDHLEEMYLPLIFRLLADKP